MLKSIEFTKDIFFIDSFKLWYNNIYETIENKVVTDKNFEEKILNNIFCKFVSLMLKILSQNKVKNCGKLLLETTKDKLENLISNLTFYGSNNMKDINKALVDINMVKLRLFYHIICVVLKDKLDINTLTKSKEDITKEIENFKIKEAFLMDSTKVCENFFRDTIFHLPNLCKVSDILLQAFRELEMDQTLINDLAQKCLPNTIKIKDDDICSVAGSNFLKKKRQSHVSTPEQNNIKEEKIYNYFKVVDKGVGAKPISANTSEKKNPPLEKKISEPKEEEYSQINPNNSFTVIGENTFGNLAPVFEYPGPRKVHSSAATRKFIEGLYYPEIIENSNFSFADRDNMTRKYFVVGNNFGNFSSSSKKSTNYSVISYPTVKEFSFIQEPSNSSLEQILMDNNSMRSNQQNYHRGINRRLPEIQNLPRTKKKQLSAKKKKPKTQSSRFYKYYEKLHKSGSDKSPSDDENSESHIKHESSYYNNTNKYDKETNFNDEQSQTFHRSNRKKTIPIKNLNCKDLRVIPLKEDLMKKFNSASSYGLHNKPGIKTSIMRENSPLVEKSDEEIIAYGTPDQVNKKYYRPKPKICVKLFNH